MSTIFTESLSSNPSALIELFEVDLSLQGGEVLRFHAGVVNPDDNSVVYQTAKDIVWDGNTYTRYPVTASGFTKDTQGTLPRPELIVSNAEGILGARSRELNDFRQCKVTRIRTHARFLDAVNFKDGNPHANPLHHYPHEIWYVARKLEEVPGEYIKYELAAPYDVMGIKLPRRQMLRVCPAQVGYRGGDCGYSGSAMFDSDGNPTSDPDKDRCGKRFTDCKLRGNQARFGGFVTIGLIRT